MPALLGQQLATMRLFDSGGGSQIQLPGARRALKKSGVDYDDLVSAIGKKNRADRALARQTRSRKLPS